MSQENYSQHKPGGYLDRLTVRKRHEMFQIFSSYFPVERINKVLDVGVTADRNALSSNYFEKYFPHKEKIIALSDQEGDFLETLYPGLKFQRGDALDLPFPAESIDVVFSSAVLEHIGNEACQFQMITECVRTAKKGVFLTTPNRWHPLEIHTKLPLFHWLPKNLHRSILKSLRMHFYAQEQNLNLLDRKTLERFCRKLKINSFEIKPIYAFGFVSNLILIINK